MKHKSKSTPPAVLTLLRELAAAEEKAGFNKNAADLRAVAALVSAWDAERQGAFNVPEWSNWEDERGRFWPLGAVAINYAAWSREEDAACSQDGKEQLADLADSMRRTLNALDRLAPRLARRAPSTR